MRFNLFLILFILFLILSITPISAVLINEGYGVPQTYNVGQNNPTSVDDGDLDELDYLTTSLNQDAVYLGKKVSEYNWKLWKWPKITAEVLKTLSKMQKNLNKVKEHVNKIQNKLNISNSKKNSENSGSYINNVNNPFCEDDACHMASELTKQLNTTFTVQNVSASDLREGDIVQYLSEGEYPRYLAVQKIEQQNSTTRHLLSNSPIKVPVCILKGTGDKTEEVPLIGACISLSSLQKVDTNSLLQTTVQIQENVLENNKKQAKNLQKISTRLDYSVYAFGGLTLILLAVSLALIQVAAETTPLPPLSAPIMVAAAISTGLFVLSGVITGLLYINSRKSVNEANNIRFRTLLDEINLNTYTATEPQDEILMDVSTFDGVPVIKQPPIPNWKEFTFIRMENPQHGDLLPGPGLQFLYGPTEGYTGPDQLKFQYTDKNGKIKCTVTVNINIKPIPAFNINPSGSVAL